METNPLLPSISEVFTFNEARANTRTSDIKFTTNVAFTYQAFTSKLLAASKRACRGCRTKAIKYQAIIRLSFTNVSI